MLLSCKSIHISTIDLNDTWNLHPWAISSCPVELEKSFLRTGVIHPPVVKQQSNRKFIPISGQRRLRFLLQNQQQMMNENINCMVIEQDVPNERLLDFILEEQSFGLPLTLAEKAQFVEISSHYFSPEEIVTKYFNQLQLKPKRSTVKILKQLLGQPGILINEAHANRIKEGILVDLLRLNQKDRIALVKLFSFFSLGESKQRKFLSQLRDIVFQTELSIADYLQSDGITNIINHSEMNIPQKINRLGIYLKETLTPASTLANKVYSEKVKSLQLPQHCSIAASPSFEKDEVTLSIKFNSIEECGRYLKSNNKL